MARTAAAQPTNQDLVGVMRSANEQMQAMTGAFSEVKDRLDRQRGELAALRQENNNLHQTVEKLQETVEKQPVVKAPQKTFAKPGKPKPSEPAKHPIVVYRDQTKKAVRINEEAFTTNARRGYGDVLGLVMNHMVQSLLKVALKPQYSIRPSTAGVLFLQAVHAGRIKKVCASRRSRSRPTPATRRTTAPASHRRCRRAPSSTRGPTRAASSCTSSPSTSRPRTPQATPAPNRKIYIVPPLTFSASATWQVDHRGIPYYWLAHCNLYGGDDAGYPWYLDTSTFLTDTNGGGLRKCPPEI